MSKRSIVTGAEGFIGKHLARSLISPVRCDINDGFGVWPPYEIDLHFKNMSCVYHLGAISSTTETDLNLISENNIKFSCMLLEECIKRDVPFVYASSASVYGLGTNGFQEDVPLTPLNYYAISKASFDNFVNLKISDNPSAKIVGLRYFNVYGTGEDHKHDMSSPVHKFIKQSKEESEIRVFQGSENYMRDFIHVSDVVDITKNAPKLPSGIYNVGTGRPRSFLDVAQIVSNLSGASIKEIPFPKNLEGKYQEFTCSDNEKITATGYDSKRKSLEEGIGQVYTFTSL